MMGGVLHFFICPNFVPERDRWNSCFLAGLYTLNIRPGSFSPRAIFLERSATPKPQARNVHKHGLRVPSPNCWDPSTRSRPRDVRYKVGRKAVLAVLTALSIFYLRVAVVLNSPRSSLDGGCADLCTCWILLSVAAVSTQPPQQIDKTPVWAPAFETSNKAGCKKKMALVKQLVLTLPSAVDLRYWRFDRICFSGSTISEGLYSK
jgi:hypothetical protein